MHNIIVVLRDWVSLDQDETVGERHMAGNIRGRAQNLGKSSEDSAQSNLGLIENQWRW